MALAWYVIHSKPNCEEKLWSELGQRDLTVFYPRLRVNPVNPRARKIVPFFPGYLFIQVDLGHTPISSLMWVPGANRMVSFDGQPATVPEDVIESLQHKIRAINAAGGDTQGGPKPGDPVRVQSGPFKGYEAVFDRSLDGTGRVRILIKMLQDRQMRLEVPKNLVKREQS